ncbi:MAG: 50S ribosomal protein L25 [Cryomorphaceae bacterium]|nr:50S ribosomal protein L25 [Flavobacteriales bacterium]
MKTVSLSGSPRENVGKKDAAHLRAEKRVPAVVYGGDDQTHFSLELMEFSKYVYTADVYRFELEIGGKKVEAILKDLQFHPVSDRIIHADFLEVIEGKPVKMELPVRITGSSIGVRNGGRLAVLFRRIKIAGMPKDFPEFAELDITKLRIGMALRIKDITIPGATILHNPDSVVVAVKRARGAMEDEEEDEEGEEGEEGEGGEGEGAEGDKSSEGEAEKKD